MSETASARPIAVSLGDPAGIGPEIICEAWVNRCEGSSACFFVVYGAQVLRDVAKARGLACPIIEIETPEDTMSAFSKGLPVLSGQDGTYTPGKPTEEGAALAYASLKHATKLTKTGSAGALVTAPIAKSWLAKVGFGHPGQTEFLADSCGIDQDAVVMMLAGPSLKAVPLTVHCSLAEVPGRLSRDLIIKKGQIVADALAKDFGVERPHLAIAGLNPHAGEEGKFGDEEARIISPAVTELRNLGIDATGPHPADAMFTARARQKYDAALCMYHDQALIPLKALEFDEGVNLSLGLPIVRTSPDHGTAFDIAGKGQADPDAMIAAIRMASECAACRSNA